MQGPGAGDVWAWPPWWPRPLRQGAPWYQFLLYCFLLSGWILVALSVGAHNAKRSADLLAPSSLDSSPRVSCPEPSSSSLLRRQPPATLLLLYFCCVLALYVYALCCGSDAATPPSF
ncbi:hypothetical protein MUK42_37554 [Musa troglodytarum]|uniref:Uncharacterized protein n=1 Tax=Musa troglodytarum TaxID=320322 RepID=A0A9E7HAC2_9LILI|nr:hypothetical protein MUK42_37554 [Musa troglodytarum]